MVERMHPQLKAVLTAHADRIHWTIHLPQVLLGIHCSLKREISHTSAELVYGTSLRLPGDLFHSSGTFSSDTVAVHRYVDDLRIFFRRLRPTLPRISHAETVFVHRHLQTCTHVFRSSGHR